MEFRCPACNTSYRVPVRVGQQVRCARCNHVWTIAESDFVLDEDAQDEPEVPEAFSSADMDDTEDAPDAHADHDHGLSSFAQRREDGAVWYDDEPAGDATSPALDHVSPDDQPAQQVDATTRIDPALTDREASAEIPDGYGETAGPAEGDAESLDRRLADSFFAGSAEHHMAETYPSETESHAAFERIMEGIEEVIAESSLAEGSERDHAEPEPDDPLRSLVEHARAPHLGDSFQTEPMTTERKSEDSEDPWGGKVVRLAARGGDRRVESRPEANSWLRDVESASPESGGTAEPMAELIDKIAEGRAEPSDFASPEERAEEPSDPEVEARDADAISDAHFEALQADMEDAAHADTEGADSQAHEGATRWAMADDQDNTYEHAQRESVALDSGQDAFDPSDDAELKTGANAGDDGGFDAHGDDFVPDDDRDEWYEAEPDARRGAPADIFADESLRESFEDDAPDATGPESDEELLAEYDFGDDELTETPMEASDQRRQTVGTLTLAAAWALFLTILAAAAVSVVSFRDQIADALPASAPAYAAIGLPVNESGLAFEDVRYEWTDTSPRTLTLSGQVKNNGLQETALPPLRVTIRDKNGAELMDGKQPLASAALASGETHDFSIDIRVPNDKLRTIELRF